MVPALPSVSIFSATERAALAFASVGHPLVLNETANQICQHRVPMLAGAAKFGGSFPMTHDGSSDSKSFGFFLGRLEQGGIDIHAQRQTERRQLFFDFVQ